MCAQACPCSLLQGQGRRLNSLLSWGKSGDLVYSQDHSPEHSASSTGADRRGISGQIREGPARQRLAGHGVVPVQRPGHWPGKVRGQPGTGSDAGLPPVQLSVAGLHRGRSQACPAPEVTQAFPLPVRPGLRPGPGWHRERGGRQGPPAPPALAQQWGLAVQTQGKEPARLEVVLRPNHVKDPLSPAETGSGLRSFMDGAVWRLRLGSKASYRLNDA